MTPPEPRKSPSELSLGRPTPEPERSPERLSRRTSRSDPFESIEATEREVLRVHGRAIASLLRQATAVAVPRSPYYGVLATFPLPPQAVKVWRRRASAALRAAATDEARPEGIDFVADLLGKPVHLWPHASELAEAARRMEDTEFGRLSAGYALLCEGHAQEAARVFAGLLRRPAVLRHRWRILEGLALSHRALGDMELSLSAIESAAEDARCGVSALVEALATTLVVGDVEKARRAAARIDMLVDPYSPIFAAAIGRLRLRGRVLGASGPEPSPALKAEIKELAGERRSAAGRVARTLL